jgi:hypothetical protein
MRGILSIASLVLFAAPARADPTYPSSYAAIPMEGPFSGLDDYCAQHPQPEDCFGSPRKESFPAPIPVKLSAPFTDIGTVTGRATCPGEDGQPASCKTERIALATGGKWWFIVLGDVSRHDASYDVLRVRPAGRRLLIRYSYGDGHHGGRLELGLVVCGVGASGTPSCYGPLATTEGEWETNAEVTRWSTEIWYRCHADLDVDDVLVMTNDGSEEPRRLDEHLSLRGPRREDCERRPQWGRHKLVFR